MLPPVRLVLLLLPPAELGSRNQRNKGRRVTRLPAAIPRPASTLDQIEMLVVASGSVVLVVDHLTYRVCIRIETHIGSRHPCSRARKECE